MNFLLDLGLPGLVFLGLSVWLVRKAVKAARTESDLEGDRLQGALAEELQAARARAAAAQGTHLAALPEDQAASVAVAPAPAAADPLLGADLRGASPQHLALVAALVAERDGQLRAHAQGGIQVLWVRSNAAHAAWCERRQTPQAAPREVICVARIEGGKVAQRWSFG